jgi:DNA topoisomerase-3
MFDKLYIAEKPSLGRAIAEALVVMSKSDANPKGFSVEQVRGKDGVTHLVVGGKIAVTWFYGHMLEQVYPQGYNPEFAGSFKKSAHLLPVIPTEWRLTPVKKSSAQLSVVESLCQKSKVIVNAGDPDPEGMLLIQEALVYFGIKKPILRMLPNAMDMNTIIKAIQQEDDNDKYITIYHRALGRSRSDWLVGMNMSRACTCANVMGDMLTVGRVQTPTLALIVKRDLEIENFKPQTYFMPTPVFAHEKGSYTGKWMGPKDHPALDKEGRLIEENFAKTIVSDVAGNRGTVAEYSITERAQKQPLPFSLSTIQAKANTMFGFTAKKVLSICQSLYETHKVASYPRTDSGFLKESQFEESPAVLAAIRKFDPSIAPLVDGADTHIKSPAWNDKQVIAHHGIIPTSAANYGALSPDERKVFALIVKQYIAQFYPPFTYKQTTVVTECGGHQFKSNGRTPIDLGWKKVFGPGEEDAPAGKKKEGEEDQLLPPMEQGDPVKCEKVDLGKKSTKAPRRYTEASLLHAMTHVDEHVEDPVMKKKLQQGKGIGTPATQASMIERLKEVGYVENKKNELISVPGAREYIRVLPAEITDPALTAQWEINLERVQQGEITLDQYMDGISTWVGRLTKKTLASQLSISLDKKAPGAQLQEAGAGSICPKCEKGTMVPRKSSKGANAGKYFLGCTAYPDCTHAQNIAEQKEATSSGGSKRKPSASKSAAPRPRASSAPSASKPAYTSTPQPTPARPHSPVAARTVVAGAEQTGTRRGFSSLNRKTEQ